ncbi:MAG: lipid A deacylase LpxR family protein [Planctomycetota bacterium]
MTRLKRPATFAGSLALSLAIAFTFPSAAAQPDTCPLEPPERPTRFHVDVLIENDSTFTFDREDRHYTSGQALAVGLPSVELADWFNTTTPFDADRAAFGFVAAYLLFTPDDIDNDAPRPGQHPYAGVAYIGGYVQRDQRLPELPGVTEFDHLQLDLGVVGPAARGEQVQSTVHDIFGGQEPNGWDAQHPDQFLVQLTYRRKWRLDLLNEGQPVTLDSSPITRRGFGIDLTPQLAASAGTLRVEAEASAIGRVGFNLPDTFGPGFVRDLPSATAADRLAQPNTLSTYLYGGGGVRLVGWDTTLDGPIFRDSSFDAESETFVGFARAGVAVGYRWDAWSAELGYGVTLHTDTIVGQQGQQHFGSLTLGLTGRF